MDVKCYNLADLKGIELNLLELLDITKDEKQWLQYLKDFVIVSERIRYIEKQILIYY
jgi:hypothetical protein